MKYKESRARKSSHEHYGDQGISLHGGLLTYSKHDKSISKHIILNFPECNSTQDVKAALFHLDILCYTIKSKK